VIFFRDDAHQKAHEKGLAVMTLGKKNKPLLPPNKYLFTHQRSFLLRMLEINIVNETTTLVQSGMML
jgi:hypothetical protein